MKMFLTFGTHIYYDFRTSDSDVVESGLVTSLELREECTYFYFPPGPQVGKPEGYHVRVTYVPSADVMYGVRS
jgi:hypothetical protein